MKRAECRQPKSVLKIAPTPFFSDRGCHVRILEEARAIEMYGWHVTICTYHNGRDVENLDIRRSMRVPWYAKTSAGPSVHKFYIDLLLMMTVLRSCARQKPDVIHAHLHEGVAIGSIAASLFRVPLIADLQGSLAGELVQHRFVREGGFSHRLFRAIERRLNRIPDALVLSSRQAMPAGPDGFVHVIADGVDAARFYPAPPSPGLRDEIGLSDGAPVIGFLGMLNEYQGVPVLLDAIRRLMAFLPEARCLIMGYPNVERYRADAERMGIAEACRFTGRVPYERAREMLAVCDIAVSPKLAVSEANGKLLNYMAVGLPVVASDTSVNREILGSDGLFTPPGDAAALAAAMRSLLCAPVETRLKIGRRLRHRAEREFSWATVGRRLVDLYETVLERRATPREARWNEPVAERREALESSA